MCHTNVSARLTVDQVLDHPWLSKDFAQGMLLPLNKLNTEINQFEIENKLRRALNVCLFLSICANPGKKEPMVATEE
jgi:hypothetical protein